MFDPDPETRRPFSLWRRLRTVLSVAAALGCNELGGPAGLAVTIVDPVSASDTIFALGQVLRFGVTGIASWTRAIQPAEIRWSSSDSTVLAIGARTGIGTTLRAGDVTVMASARGTTGTLTLTVAQRIVSLELRTAAPAVLEADTLSVILIARDANGFPVGDPPAPTWATSDSATAVIDAAGVLTARRRGLVTVRATLGDATGTADVRVDDGFLVAQIDNSSNGATCGVDLAGTGYCWGFLSPLAVRIPGDVRWMTLSAGWSHTCGLATDGRAYCWGTNNYGEVGLGVGGVRVLEPTPVTVLQGITRIRASAHNFTCAITAAAEPFCWGHNDRGQLGRGFRSSAEPAPAPVLNVPALDVIDGDMFHACGITPAGGTRCWGIQNATGVPPETTSDTAIVIDAGIAFVTLSTGSYFTCALTAQGAAWCWGLNPDGNLGTGDTLYAPTPRPVGGGLTFSAIDAGGWYACGVTVAGQAYCWGRSGPAAGGTPTERWTPVLVVPDHRFRSIAAGEGGACGITDRSAVYCWGGGLSAPARVLRGVP